MTVWNLELCSGVFVKCWRKNNKKYRQAWSTVSSLLNEAVNNLTHTNITHIILPSVKFTAIK